MRYISLTVLFYALILTAAAQEKKRADSLRSLGKISADTVIMEDVNTGEKRKVRIIVPGKDEGMITIEKSEKAYQYDSDDKQDGKRVSVTKDHPRKSYPIYGVTLSRIDLGLVKLMDNGSFSLSDDNDIFDYRRGKTVNFGFDVLQAGYRFNDQFRIFLSGGFDWTYIRLKGNYIFDPDIVPLTVVDDQTDIRNNRLTSTYLRLPLTFEFRSKNYSGMGRMRFAFGPEGGFLLKGTQRYRGADGKVKQRGDYAFNEFRYGAFARFGVGAFGIYAKYYFNDIFENSPQHAGLQNFTFGLMLGF
ncbi:Outer membrane protein beta-barrel domain-containing protein [Parapedobacter luteus]|uniref:Outer membrane protein beta-barrel domain-containing protein n=1 Tax=Parapedobacter luteus TaxID=623280 RepID=A0A1T5F9K6_9SPHI|nr:outer membrane beta-barrel protein [Parapedobacter luteus]SKB92865.1 Outer membrane protein beta-barrel domain-containing protein [Parapedobacter luteus]